MFPFGKRTKFKREKGLGSELEPQELEVVGLFLNRDRPGHAAFLDQLAKTNGGFRTWTPDGYELKIVFYENWLSPLAEPVESQRITAPRVDQPGELTFWIVIHEVGFFQGLYVQATSGHMEKNRLWQVDLTGIQPAYVELTPASDEDRFNELAAFLDMDEDALRTWADTGDVRIRWNLSTDPIDPKPRDPQYAEFSRLVDTIAADDRAIIGGQTDEDVELDGKDYALISYSREIDNVFLREDRILVDGVPTDSPDFRTFLINFLGIGAAEPSSPTESQEG